MASTGASRGLVVVALLALAGCGISSGIPAPGNGIAADTTTQALKAMNAAVSKATAVHIAGSVKSGGSTLSMDISVQLPGRMTGTLSTSTQGSFQVATTDDTTIYLTPDAEFWKAALGVKSLSDVTSLVGKCLVVVGSDSEFANLPQELKQIMDISDLAQVNDSVGVVKAGVTTVDGVTAEEFTAKDKSKVLIATSGKPLPVELIQPGTGSLKLTKWNVAVPVSLPQGCLTTTQVQQIAGAGSS